MAGRVAAGRPAPRREGDPGKEARRAEVQAICAPEKPDVPLPEEPGGVADGELFDGVVMGEQGPTDLAGRGAADRALLVELGGTRT